ncbi:MULTISPECIES: site-specific DNA-methyltransferase [Sphingomonadaceae]|uniref:site-specific DNA-methyltransferase n=1 Tax=Sphingomonadales TaxID=204457 RepID=UPI00037CCC6D|nr:MULTISPECIES: site-specific DNA-methyltransferase [Sphingomonadaceae]
MTRKTKLELTWPGKEERLKLEPRILLEHPECGHHAATKRDGDLFDNMLIKGDNLLALKALEQDYAGKIKCVYVDPPFNTGAAFDHYDDGLEHSIWLSLMRQRLEIIRNLLTADGAIFVHLDDNEADYCKVLMDEIFGRKNFISRLTVEARAPSAFSTVNPGVFKASEYILWYARDRGEFSENSGRVKRDPDYAYGKWLSNPEALPSEWRLESLADVYDLQPPGRSRHPRTMLERFNSFIIENASRICRLASISDTGAGQAIVDLKRKSLKNPGIVHHMQREGDLDDVFVLDGQQLIFYGKNVVEIDGERTASRLLTNIWTDIAWEGIANEGGVRFPKGKKPERLLRRCIELTSNPGDLILDSFAGSGTTGAVAHKMGRRWIMVEIGDQADTHIVPRLNKVIDGEDLGGITKAVDWKGGGGFRYFTLAPSLLERDAYNNWVIAPEYNGPMLAQAMCKHLGFTYDPAHDEAEWWRHGRSSESDFLYVTTQALTQDALRLLSQEVGPERSLLICARAFSGNIDAFENLTCRKIPSSILTKCEWGRDDYSLNVAALPVREDDDGDADAGTLFAGDHKNG